MPLFCEETGPQIRSLLTNQINRDLRRTTIAWIMKPLAIAFLLTGLSSIATRSVYHSDYYKLRQSTDAERDAKQRHIDDVLDKLNEASGFATMGIYCFAFGVYYRLSRRMWNSARLLSQSQDTNSLVQLTELICRPIYGSSETHLGDLRTSVKTGSGLASYRW